MGWGISKLMIKQWCMNEFVVSIAENRVLEIINSYQESQYYSLGWTNYLKGRGIKISMDLKGRATDDIWIERFWRAIKYNHIFSILAIKDLNYSSEFRFKSNIITRRNIKAL